MGGSRRWRRTCWLVAIGLSLSILELAAPLGADAIGSLSIPRCTPEKGLVCLTNQAGGHLTRVRRGDHIEVTLRGTKLDWSIVRQLSSTVLRRIGTPIRSSGESRTTFIAVHDGRATLEATATSKCSPGSVCPQFVLLWQTVIVVAG